MSPREVPTARVCCYQRQCGFGVVEVMIALTLGLLLILGISQLYISASKTQMALDESSQFVESAIFSGDYLMSEMRLAALWGEAKITRNTVTALVKNGATNDIATFDNTQRSPICVGTGRSGEGVFNELVRGMANPMFAGSADALLPELGLDGQCAFDVPLPKDGSEFVVIRRAATCSYINRNGTVNETCLPFESNYHLQVDGCQYRDPNEEKIVLSNNPNLSEGSEFAFISLQSSLGNAGNCALSSASDRAPIYRYLSKIFYVDRSDRLIALVLSHNTSSDSGSGPRYWPSVIARGVEHLSFEWGIDVLDAAESADNYGSGIPELWVLTGDSVMSKPDYWNYVVAARLWWVVRTDSKTANFQDTKSYDIPGYTFAPDETFASYQRTVMSQTVRIPNLAWTGG